MKYNKGEWSEAYAFIKLIGDGYIYASDEKLNKVSNKAYNILKVFKDEIKRYYEINSKNDLINIVDYNGNIINTINRKTFRDVSNKSLEIIKKSSGRIFEVPILNDFLNKIGIEHFKSSSMKKEDIKIEMRDIEKNMLTFSIKSRLGYKPTLLNASKLTNFTYELSDISEEDIDYLNGINKEFNKKWLKIKFNKLFTGNYNIKLVNENDDIFYHNLRIIDNKLPDILAFILFYFYSHEKINSVELLTEKLIEFNPLNLNHDEKYVFYKEKIIEFIEAVTFGMMPNMKWDGNNELSGGLITVKNDGELLCHNMLYDRVALRNYLFKNTKLESPSTAKHKYGHLFKINDETFFKLNLQLRLK